MMKFDLRLTSVANVATGLGFTDPKVRNFNWRLYLAPAILSSLLILLLVVKDAAATPIFPIVTSSKELVVCERRGAGAYGLRALYRVEGIKLRSTKLSALRSQTQRELKKRCRRGDTSEIGGLDPNRQACVRGDRNADLVLDNIDLKLLARARRLPNLSGSRAFDRDDLRAIRGCWEHSRDPNAQPYGLTERSTIPQLAIPLNDPAALGSGSVAVLRAFPSLTFNQPVFITSARDQSNRLFVVEKPGVIKVFANTDSVSSSSVFLDISAKIDDDGEQGLLGLAFDPNYSQNGFFYVHYNPAAGARRSVIARYHVSGNPNVADAASETIVLQVTQPSGFSNHKGGMLAFGSDNMLYIALGDGGSAGDPNGTGQDCSDLLGNILRIDPHGGSPYAVPAGNPFAGAGNHSCGNQTSAVSRNCGISGRASGQICAEVWAYGLRNPWRFSFDRSNGSLWVGDVGQDTHEEVDVIHSGDNLGWNVFEGLHDYQNPSHRSIENFTAPIHEYSHGSDGGDSISGGYVYRGQQIPSLYGKYVYGDYVSGRVWALTYDGTSVSANTQIASVANLSSFGEDEAGELFALNIGSGAVFRFVPGSADPGTPIPDKLSETGLFSDTTNLVPVVGAVPYDVIAPLWSDGALKRRWILVPGTQKISFDTTEAFDFPVGTAIVKQFDLAVSPSVTRRIETRVFFRHTQGWTGYTYRWNEAQTEAHLLSDGLDESFTVVDASGSHLQEWHYPSRNECFSCHTTAAGTVLGIRTRQLNGDFNYSGVVDNQLRSWNHIGLFSTGIGSHSAYGAYAGYTDASQPLARRARSYLAANCSHCHQPTVPRPGVVDLRYDAQALATHLLNTAPTYGDLGLSNAARVRVGSKESSVLWERTRRVDEFRMPPLGSNVADPTGVDLIGEWIDQGAQD